MINNLKLSKVSSYNEAVELSNLSKVNFFFGSNGSGKSTIAKTISNFEVFPPNNKYSFCSQIGYNRNTEKIFVFDETFVEKNFILSNELEGVFTLNEGNDDIDDEIKELKINTEKLEVYKKILEERKRKIKLKLNSLNLTLKEDCWSERSSFDTFFELDLEYSRNKENHLRKVIDGIEYLPQNFNIKLEELNNKYKELYEVKLLKLEKRISKEIYESIENLELKIIPLMEEVIDASKDVDIADLIETLGIRKWVDDGRKFIFEKNESLCPYCQKETNDEELKNKFKKYFNDNYVKKIDEIESLKVEYIELTKSLLDNIFEVSKIYNEKNVTSEVHKELTDLFNDNIKSFEKKIAKSNEIIEFFTIDNCQSEIENINDEIEENNQKIAELNTNKTTLTDNIWDYLSSNFANDYKDYKLYEAKTLTTTNKINQTIADINIAQNNIKTTIDELKEQTVTTDEAVKNINIILKNTGFDSFEIAEKTTFNNISRYYLKRDGIETDVFKTLSEGEKNFIAFLYFYQLVLGTDDREQDVLKRIIVIDDPVSSLDSKVLFILSTLIHKLIEYSQLNKREFKNSNISQVFILTHNIYFYKEVSLNKRPICKDRSHFHVYRHNEFSNIEHKGIDTFISNDYTLLWKTIKELKDTENTTFNITLCNNMRRLIESYINFIGIGHNNWDCLDNINVDDPIYIICSSLISEINDSSHRVSVFDELYYHRIINVNPQQIFSAFELIFRSIGEQHYEMMMN